MKNLIFTFLLICLMISCSKDNKTDGIVIDSGVLIRISDVEGNDLLNPNINNPKAIDLDKIRIFYVVDGKHKEFHKPNYAAPKAFLLIEPYGEDMEYKLKVFLNSHSTKDVKWNVVDTANTVIYWNENEKDVITSLVDKKHGNQISIKVLLNGNVVWTTSKEQENLRGFRIIK